MPEKEIKIDTADGPMTAFVVAPAGDGAHPVVIQYFDAGGLREEIKEMARRYSEGGFYVIAPDLYHRWGEGIEFDANEVFEEGGEAKRAEMFALIGKTTDAMFIADTAAVLQYVKTDAAAGDGPKGVVGYCLGGRAVVRALAAFAGDIKAGSALHPSQMVSDKPDSPHLDIAKFAADSEIYFGLGGDDFVTPPPVIDAILEELERGAAANVVDITPGATHGFTMKSRDESYNAAADKAHWDRTLDLFGRKLAHS